MSKEIVLTSTGTPSRQKRFYSAKIPYRENDTVRSHQVGLSLFRTCRQISREAASVFYTNNTFLITRERLWGSIKHDSNCMYGSRVLETWLERLGDHRALIKNICLDLDSMCRIHCEVAKVNQHGHGRDAQYVTNSSDFAFLPFVKAVWKYKLHAEVTVAQINPLHHRWNHAEYRPFLTLAAMSTILSSLCKDDLEIARFSRTLGCMALKEDGSGGDIVYRTTRKHTHIRETASGKLVEERMRGNAGFSSHACNYTAKQISLGPDGQLHLEQDTAKAALLKLPRHLRGMIWGHFIRDRQAHVVDINSSAGFTNAASVLYLNHNIRQQYAAEFLEVGLILKINHTSTNPGRFPVAKIERVLDTSIQHTPFGNPSAPPRAWRVGTEANLQFKLDFKLDAPTELEDLRIGMLQFVIASSQTWNTTPVTFALEAPTIKNKEVAIKLALLRSRVLKALRSYAKEHADEGGVCPEIWVNGYGQVKEVALKKVTDSGTRDDPEKITGHVQDGDESTLSVAPRVAPTKRLLHSTIRDLAKAFRTWQKAK